MINLKSKIISEGGNKDECNYRKKKVMLSLPIETNTKLEELAKRFGMSKSGLVNFLINQTEEIGTIYKKKKSKAGRRWTYLLFNKYYTTFCLALQESEGLWLNKIYFLTSL